MEPKEETSVNFNNNLTLKALFVVLLLFFISELGFIIINSNNKIKSNNNSNNTDYSTAINVSPSAKNSNIQVSNLLLGEIVMPYISKANSPTVVTNSKVIILSDAYVKNKTTGDTISLDLRGLIEEIKTFDNDQTAQANNPNRKDLFHIVLDEEKYKLTKIFDSSGKTISFEDLKVANTIKIVEVYDLVKNIDKSIEITVLY